MNKTLFTLLFCLIISQISFAQQEKIYYDSEWKVSNKSKAEYYRLITFDENGKPKGKVKDFYITGELQWEGYFSYVDKYDNNKDINEGLSIWYYKNGNKSRQSNFINDLQDGLTTYWYKSGEKQSETFYENGKANGKHIVYHKSGKIRTLSEYRDGKMVNKYLISCDEFNNCKKEYTDYLSKNTHWSDWDILDNEYFKTSFNEEGFLIETFNERNFTSTANIPLNLNNDFSIETRITNKDGNDAFGLIWGFKDWDDYNFFIILKSGYFKIGSKLNGIKIGGVDWEKSSMINTQGYNKLKILRASDKLYYAINSEIVHISDFYGFKRNEIGFTQGKNLKVVYHYLEVTQDINEEIQNSTDINNNEWKGNGTGFFIDKKGYIATNYHVVEEANDIEIEFVRNGLKQTFPAKLVQSDKQNDISIIKITSSDFNPFIKLPYNFKTEISDVGSNVFALGYPLLSLMGNEIKFTDGKISSKTGIQGDITSYQISVPIQAGNSGGPLFDFDGNLIGITSSGINRKLDLTENVNYAIKSSYLKNLIDVLDYKLSLPNDSAIANMTLTEKIKLISDYVVLIKIK